MKALVVVALAVLHQLSIAGKCTTSDMWRGPDKTKHLIGGAAIGSAVTLATDKPFYGWMAGTAVGALKEAVDRRGYGTCSFQDFAVTSLGAAAGAYGTAWVILPMRDGVFVGYSAQFK